MTNYQWYKRFNTKVYVGTSIGVTRQHLVILECTAHSIYSASYQDITDDQKIEIQTDAKERCLAYILLKDSTKTIENLITNLSEKYTTGENKYPRSRQTTLHYLEKHINSVVRAPIAKEGISFAQRKGNGNPDTFDKNYWKDKECYKCGDKGHPASYCKTTMDTKLLLS